MVEESWDFKREIGRKVIHLLSLSFLIIYAFFSSYFNHKIALIVLAFLLTILIEIEYFRLEIGKHIPILSYLWRMYKREREREALGGEVFFLIGSIICLAVFETRIAFAAILMTTFGDLASSLVGRKFHNLKIHYLKNKAFEGIFAELIVDLIVGFLVFYYPFCNFSGAVLWPIALVMALTATFVETVVSKIDDNLLIPLFSGFNGQITYFILLALSLI